MDDYISISIVVTRVGEFIHPKLELPSTEVVDKSQETIQPNPEQIQSQTPSDIQSQQIDSTTPIISEPVSEIPREEGSQDVIVDLFFMRQEATHGLDIGLLVDEFLTVAFNTISGKQLGELPSEIQKPSEQIQEIQQQPASEVQQQIPIDSTILQSQQIGDQPSVPESLPQQIPSQEAQIQPGEDQKSGELPSEIQKPSEQIQEIQQQPTEVQKQTTVDSSVAQSQQISGDQPVESESLPQQISSQETQIQPSQVQILEEPSSIQTSEPSQEQKLEEPSILPSEKESMQDVIVDLYFRYPESNLGLDIGLVVDDYAIIAMKITSSGQAQIISEQPIVSASIPSETPSSEQASQPAVSDQQVQQPPSVINKFNNQLNPRRPSQLKPRRPSQLKLHRPSQLKPRQLSQLKLHQPNHLKFHQLNQLKSRRPSRLKFHQLRRLKLHRHRRLKFH
ncbi:hypothetical protein WR25_13402 [Diploscapter pachys]|uniref:Uncharacterized protein n=1 Tax=Diploscapter pachys TaxID=2018661 RepID=A0A2A2JET5_9BILA|nr:hypothetical protein WR25_13402 [Diploscapter pachys]